MKIGFAILTGIGVLLLCVVLLAYASLYVLHFLVGREATVRWLQRKEARNPNNPQWAGWLGTVYQMRMWRRTGLDRREAARRAVAHHERWLGLCGDITHDYSNLNNLAMAAVEAEQFPQAKKYALRLLNLSKRYETRRFGNAIHYGNIVLGRLALRQGNVAEAKAFLLKAGATPGSAQLNSFGPTMILAKELLEASERDVVLDYFVLCAAFWVGDTEDKRRGLLRQLTERNKRGLLRRWAKDAEQGKMPNFARSLRRG